MRPVAPEQESDQVTCPCRLTSLFRPDEPLFRGADASSRSNAHSALTTQAKRMTSQTTRMQGEETP